MSVSIEESRTNSFTDAEIARKLVEAIPKTMWFIRGELRSYARPGLTVPQLRLLSHIHRGIRLTSELAEMHGISLPAMSTLVDGLVRRGLLTRNPGIEDRRKIVLSLSKKGESVHEQLGKMLEERLVQRIGELTAKDRTKFFEGLEILVRLFP